MDKAKSVIAKLKNKSKQSGNSLQLHMQLFCQEELLRRLSLSKYRDNFVLKGGLLIYTLTNFESRPTVDMDFLLRNMGTREDELYSAVEEIIGIETGNEFVEFEIQKTEKITLERKYTGISIQLIACIGKTRSPIYMDFGVGDVIIPDSEIRTIKTQLEDYDEVKISTYSIESTIAEKFESILQRMELTSRMKDFYDIQYLARTFEFDADLLHKAIESTIRNRGTSLEQMSFENVRKLVDNPVINSRWKNFIRKLKIEVEINEVIRVIGLLLGDIVNNIVNGHKSIGKWNPSSLKWSK